MVKVTYKERHFINKYRCIDYEKELLANSYFVGGISNELYYFRLDEFNYKTLGKDEIINIEEVKR